MSALAEWFAAQSTGQKMESARRLGILCHSDGLHQIGLCRSAADFYAAQDARCSSRSLSTWRARVRGMRLDDPDTLHRLCPGGTATRASMR